MALQRRQINIFFIAFIFLITNFVVHHNNLSHINQSEIIRLQIKSSVAIFIPATQINPFLLQASKSKDDELKTNTYSFSTDTLSYEFNLYSDKITYLIIFSEQKYSQKSSRAPPIA